MGICALPQLRQGAYAVRVKAAGFKEDVAERLTLSTPFRKYAHVCFRGAGSQPADSTLVSSLVFDPAPCVEMSLDAADTSVRATSTHT